MGCMQGRGRWRTPGCLQGYFFKGELDSKSCHVVFQFCQSDLIVGCDNYHYLISALGETKDEELFSLGSMDETMGGQGKSVARTPMPCSINVPWLISLTSIGKSKWLSCSSWKWVCHGQPPPTKHGQQHSFTVCKEKRDFTTLHKEGCKWRRITLRQIHWHLQSKPLSVVTVCQKF